MLSHQDRVKWNYCNHEFPSMDITIMMNFPDLPDGRRCIKCGASWDKVYSSRIVHISTPVGTEHDWIKKRFL